MGERRGVVGRRAVAYAPLCVAPHPARNKDGR